jgi:hypothetical protein
MLYYRRRTRRILKQVYGKATRKQGNSRGGRDGVVVCWRWWWRSRFVAMVRCELAAKEGRQRNVANQTRRPMRDCLAAARGPASVRESNQVGLLLAA